MINKLQVKSYKLKVVRFFSFFFFLFSFFSPLVSCQTDIQTINQITSASLKNLPAESSMNTEVLYSDSGKVKMKLIAPRLDHYADKEFVEFPIGVKMDFYNDSMKVTSKLKADYGIRYEKDGKMEVKRNVEVINVKGEKLNTEDLIYDESKNLIHTNAFVKITTNDEVMYGDGLTSNRDFTKYKITNIKGMFNIKEEEKKNSSQ